MRQEFDSPTPHNFQVETNTKNLIGNIPKEVLFVTKVLEEAGFSAYLVGGCVREVRSKDHDGLAGEGIDI